MQKSVLRKYANLLIRKGLNVQPGQVVEIRASLDQPEFIKMCVEEAYKAKASDVIVTFNYQPIDKIVMNKSKFANLKDFNFRIKGIWDYREKMLPCMLYIESDDPDGLKGMNQEKAAKVHQELYKFIKPIRNRMENKYQWCIAAVPGVNWARKMFPNVSKHQAVENLWKAILEVSRVTLDPIKAWELHNKDLQARCAYLNNLNLDYLHYESKESGTNFTVWMNENVIWEGGSEVSLGNGIEYNPNIPSEECFTSPLKGKAEGIVYSSKPLSYNGQVIDKFSVRFEKGRVVEYHAEQNEELLGHIINMDEGAHYLGECALIPFDSPISNSGLLFYSTLFDENASCHLALGHGFTNLYKGYENFTQEELHAKGINDSITHVDFMIGTKDFEITGHTRDGKDIKIFTKGNWAF